MSEEQERALKKHYVYELVNGKTGEVFYVGKGTEERMFAHELEAEKIESSLRRDKHQMIIDLKGSGNLKGRVIGRYNSEEEAWAVESTLINWVYDFDKLTNLTRGMGSKYIRAKSAPFEELDGIDVPERIKVNDGKHSKKNLENRDKHGVVEYMQEVKSYLAQESSISLSEVDDSDAKFTRLFSEYSQAKIAIYAHHSGTKNLTVLVESSDGKKSSRELIQQICEASDNQLVSKAGGTYAKLEWVKAMALGPELIEAFKATQSALEQGINDTA